MKRADMKDIVDCLEYIQDYRMNIILDKLNYIIPQQERNRNECKKKLNAIYGYKPTHFLTSAEIYKYIPFAEFVLSINSEIVKRRLLYDSFRGMYGVTKRV